MAAIIIDFRAYHHHKTAGLNYPEPASLRTKRARRNARRASADKQIAHVAWLIRELEDIARSGERLPPVLVAEARASIERMRKILQSWPAASTSGKTDAPAGDSDQPNIDPALLDRMYGDLGLNP